MKSPTPLRRGPRSFPVVAEDRGYETPCWIWQAAVNTAGYGTRGKPCANPVKLEQTHRAAYEFAFGPLDPELILHHLCEQKRCMNPSHMVPISRARHIRLHKPEQFQNATSRPRRQGDADRTGHFVDTLPGLEGPETA